MTGLERLLDAVVREDLLAFAEKVFTELGGSTHLTRNWHHEAIAWQLKKLARSQETRLIVTLPPRHLKSIITSVAWVAWMLGRDPRLRFMCISYNSDLAAKFARDCRQVMQSDWYQRAFPQTVLARTAEMDLETTMGGGRFSTSIGGTLTGRGADIIVIDDPLKADEAYSETARRHVNEWVTGALLSRLNNKRTGRIVLVMQRLHEDDLAGLLLTAGDWHHLSLPAIAEGDEDVEIGEGRHYHRINGEPLHAAMEPLEVLARLKANMGSAAFSAQYQQAPVPASGNMILPEWLRYYDDPPRPKVGDRIVQSWDTATKDGILNDHSVCLTALVRGETIWIIDVFRRQLKFPDLRRQVRLQADRHGADIILIEDAASGQQLLQVLQAEPTRGLRPIAFKPEGDKATRMSAGSQVIERGDVVLPREAPWLADFQRELFAFPYGKHDDQADALSQLLIWFERRPKIRAIVPWIGTPADSGFSMGSRR